ncbi:MAG: hypothetical protein GY882_03420 [Actinomycetia bacterium]|nr:hypothetical protein [Actinomycetes bacterium]
MAGDHLASSATEAPRPDLRAVTDTPDPDTGLDVVQVAELLGLAPQTVHRYANPRTGELPSSKVHRDGKWKRMVRLGDLLDFAAKAGFTIEEATLSRVLEGASQPVGRTVAQPEVRTVTPLPADRGGERETEPAPDGSDQVHTPVAAVPDVDVISREVHEAEVRVAQLEKDLEAAEGKAQKDEDKISQLTGDLESARAELDRLGEELAKTSGRLETTKDELDGAKASLETKAAELGESQRRNGSLEAELGESQRRNGNLEADLQSTEAEHRDLLATATKSVYGTRSERKQARARLKSQVGEGSLEEAAGTGTDEVTDEAGSKPKGRMRTWYASCAEINDHHRAVVEQ